jgi:hypothetical protein
MLIEGDMTTFDKFLGAFLFLVALPAAIQAGINWYAISLLIAACLVFLGFVVQAKKERCNRCGHYYVLTAYEAYVKKAGSKRCENCEIVHHRVSDPKSALSGK